MKRVRRTRRVPGAGALRENPGEGTGTFAIPGTNPVPCRVSLVAGPQKNPAEKSKLKIPISKIPGHHVSILRAVLSTSPCASPSLPGASDPHLSDLPTRPCPAAQRPLHSGQAA
jgi:hypothetical protein